MQATLSLCRGDTSAVIADLTLTWINEQLRVRAAEKKAEELENIPRHFWNVQILRLLTLSVGGICWFATQSVLGA